MLDRAFVAYVDSAAFGAASFPAFLVTWLAAGPLPVVDLFTVVNSGAVARTAAVEGNLAFIREERTRMRELLCAGARAGKLPSQRGAMLADFAAKPGEVALESELDALDEQGEQEEATLAAVP